MTTTTTTTMTTMTTTMPTMTTTMTKHKGYNAVIVKYYPKCLI